MKSYLFYVGIDISKLKLDVVLIENVSTNKSEHFIVDNTTNGIKLMLSHLKKKKIELEKNIYKLSREPKKKKIVKRKNLKRGRYERRKN